jgi:hypothetical protein
MTAVVAQLRLAHLIGESWHLEDLLLYGGASVGLVLGIGLFRWGRGERVRQTDHPAASDVDGDVCREPPGRLPPRQ